MILNTAARYFTDTDCIQVGIIVQNDDRTSAAAKLQSGTVEILHGTTAVVSEQFDRRHKVMWFADGSTTPVDQGNFLFLYHHPPMQKNARVRVSVTLTGSLSATQVVNIDAESSDKRRSWLNPSLAGLPATEYPDDGTVPIRAPENIE